MGGDNNAMEGRGQRMKYSRAVNTFFRDLNLCVVMKIHKQKLVINMVEERLSKCLNNITFYVMYEM